MIQQIDPNRHDMSQTIVVGIYLCQSFWVYVYICHPSSGSENHHPNKFKWPRTKRHLRMPRKALMFRDWGRIGNNSEDWSFARISQVVGVDLRVDVQSPRDFWGVFLVGEQLIELIYNDIHTYQGEGQLIYIRMVSTASRKILWPLPCLKSLTRNRKLHWNPIFPARMSTLSHHCSHCWKRILGFLEGWKIKHLAQLVHIFLAIHIYTDRCMWIGMWEDSPFDQFSSLPLS